MTSAHERLVAETEQLETAIYAALDAIDSYRRCVDELAAVDAQQPEVNVGLQKRLAQFDAKATAMTSKIEDDVLTDLLFCVDRVFSVDQLEKGEFL